MTAQMNQQPTPHWPTQLEAARLGLLKAGHFSPVSVSSTPYVLSQSSWKMVQVTSRAIGKLFSNVAKNETWLNEALQDIPADCFARRLLDVASNQNEIAAANVNLSRHDFLLDANENWKLVESNTIAAGMGPFSDQLQKTLSEQLALTDFAPNNSATLQAKAFIDETKAFMATERPNVVIVVEEHEDNIFDQRMMADAFENQNAVVYFRTLKALQFSQIDDPIHFATDDIGRIDALYFRTGYNLADFGSTSDEQNSGLRFRGEIETKKIALSPSIRHQIASNKWVQMKLSKLSVSSLMREFQLTMQEAILAQLALSTPQYPANQIDDLRGRLASGDWVLKSQGEGGGNIICEHNLDALPGDFSGSVLMQKINPAVRSNEVTQVIGDTVQTISSAQSELGLFTSGEHQHYAGYLLRTKPITAIETGVHKGFGMIDTVQLSHSNGVNS